MAKPNTCSFCGLSQNEVKKLFSGPTLFICDRCVGKLGSQVQGSQSDQEVTLREEIEKTVAESFRHIVANLNLGPLHDKYQRLVKVKFKEGPESPTFPEVFAEFKRRVEEEIPSGDYKSRYDLAIAYSEMGLKEDAFRELIQSLRYALMNDDYDRAADIMSALLIVHFDPARVISALRRVFSETLH